MYSQGEEEKYILENLPDTGTLLDIGAHNGKMFSNTLALIEKGWRGMLVEPSLQAFGDLLKLHGENKSILLVHTLIGITDELQVFWNSADGLSTTSLDHYIKWKDNGGYSPVYLMPQVTVSSLLKTYSFSNDISMVNIDTEGTSAELFLSFPFEFCIPKLFCVEYYDMPDEVIKHAEQHCYKMIYQNAENVILVRE